MSTWKRCIKIQFSCANQRGLSLLSISIATVILFVSYWAYATFESYTMKNQSAFREKYIANLFALELLEFFRGYNSSTSLLNDYLLASVPAIPLCTKINAYSRQSGTFTRPDPVAVLDLNPLDTPITNGKAYRYYKVEVVDMATLLPNSNACAAGVVMNPNERLLVTVGINWIPHGEVATREASVELSSVIPGL